MSAGEAFLLSLPLWRVGTEGQYLPAADGDERLALLFTDEDLAAKWAEQACRQWEEMARQNFRPVVMPTWADLINFLELHERGGCRRVAIDQSASARLTRVLELAALLRDARLAQVRDNLLDEGGKG